MRNALFHEKLSTIKYKNRSVVLGKTKVLIVEDWLKAVGTQGY